MDSILGGAVALGAEGVAINVAGARRETRTVTVKAPHNDHGWASQNLVPVKFLTTMSKAGSATLKANF
jgi:hypothetical protein